MIYLDGNEEKVAWEFIEEAIKIALNSTCYRSRCGSVIVKDNKIIGRGFNSPPLDKEENRRCNLSKGEYHKKVTDKTCCIHAEQRAIINAIKNDENLENSRLYFIRLDEKGNPAKAGNPYCTICSKMALDLGIKEFVLWHEEGICVHNTEEYNKLSFNYKE